MVEKRIRPEMSDFWEGCGCFLILAGVGVLVLLCTIARNLIEVIQSIRGE